MNPAERLMENLLLCIKDQIKHAKALNGEALSEATAHRQDLLFELELEHKNNNVSVTERMKELHQEITTLDERLISILATVTNEKVIKNVIVTNDPISTPRIKGSF